MSTRRARLAALLPLAASVLVGLALYEMVTLPAGREVRRGFESHARSAGGLLSLAVAAAVQSQDARAVERYLAAASAEQALTYAVVRKLDGQVMAGFHPELAPFHPELLAPGGRSVEEAGALHLVLPVAAGQEQVGWLQAGFDLAVPSRSMEGTRLGAGVVALVAVGLSATVFSRSATLRKQMMEQIAATSTRLRATSVTMVSASSQQASAAAQHAAAVEETRRTMQSLVESAARIATASREVLGHADQSVHGAQAVSQAIRTFAIQAEKIGDISELIRSIADKSDLLALNASLEGTKAGEAGRAFSLVANEMRRLSESVLGAAREIKSLSGAIRGASESVEASVVEMRTASERTSQSTREISRITEQQREATEQVTKSMNELGAVIADSGSTIRRTEESAEHLLALADSLAQLTAQVVRPPGAGGGGGAGPGRGTGKLP
ncbi:MAG TPA: methyl-accepting chemotaxis protein [Myxococcales bacterium]|nr:methyl-accepting chemotaxis protein [Myxococcales bacterium]